MGFGSSTTWEALLNGNDGYQFCFCSRGTYQLPLSCSFSKCAALLLSHLLAGIRRVVIVQSSTLSSQSYLPLLRRLPSNKGKHRQGRNLSPFCKSAKGARLQLFILREMAQPKLLITEVLYLQNALCNSEHPFKTGYNKVGFQQHQTASICKFFNARSDLPGSCLYNKWSWSNCCDCRRHWHTHKERVQTWPNGSHFCSQLEQP